VPSQIRVGRVYDAPSPADGARVLVDRLWPRGLRKDAAHLTEWAKDVAPSTELRTWYGHDPEKLDEFRVRYLDELSGRIQQAELGKLRALAANGPMTLLTATRDVDISQAAVLAEILRQDVDPDKAAIPSDGLTWSAPTAAPSKPEATAKAAN
jgi:uncharacterized protein YeaO (DUF488 family)